MNRYSFTGKGSILLRAVVSGKYGDKNYDIGEPIAYFTDAEVSINFAYQEKIPRVSIENLTVAAKSSPSFLTISNIKITDSVQSLLYKKQENKTKNQTIVKNLTSSGGLLFLPLESDEEIIGQIFIYDVFKERVTTYTFSGSNNSITGLQDGRYTIFYSISKVSAATFFLDTPTLPYLSAEIEVVGNLKGSTGSAVIHLNKVALLTRPTLDFNTETPFVDTLEFAILSDKEAEVNYYAG